MKTKMLIVRLIACFSFVLLSACANSGQQAVPLYYQPALYGHQAVPTAGMEFYGLPRR